MLWCILMDSQSFEDKKRCKRKRSNVMMVMGWWKYGKHTQCNIGGPYTDRENMTLKLILSQKQ